ncbi:MAG TPA: phospholipase A [Polyangiaceae bacterium]|nr:phospholipase A [Polyangiaceae bacterium]
MECTSSSRGFAISLFLLHAAIAAPTRAAESSANASPGGTPPGPTAAPSHEAELDLLTFYKDNYFITGFSMETEAKFQFSAKFDIWPNRGQHAVYFAFTQKSLWDIYRTSFPFVENNYAPELFYSFFHVPGRYEPAPGCGFFFERVGAIHESTGESGDDSRGWNRVYGESRFACYDPAHRYGALTLQVWAPPFGKKDNPDIASYQGYGELTLSVGSDRGRGWLGDWELAVHGRKGTKNWSVGSLELDGRWRPRYGDFWRFTPYLYAQFFTGYGETLLSYDRSTTSFRVGIGFTDLSTRAE